MPELARVDGAFACPYCRFASGPLRVQWGQVPEQYEVGDLVRWLTRDGQVVKPYTRHWDEPLWNAGDPTLPHVLVRDTLQFQEDIPPRCGSCGHLLGGAVIEISQNRIVGGRLLEVDELPPGRCFLVTPQGPVRRQELEGRTLELSGVPQSFAQPFPDEPARYPDPTEDELRDVDDP